MMDATFPWGPMLQVDTTYDASMIDSSIPTPPLQDGFDIFGMGDEGFGIDPTSNLPSSLDLFYPSELPTAAIASSESFDHLRTDYMAPGVGRGMGGLVEDRLADIITRPFTSAYADLPSPVDTMDRPMLFPLTMSPDAMYLLPSFHQDAFTLARSKSGTPPSAPVAPPLRLSSSQPAYTSSMDIPSTSLPILHSRRHLPVVPDARGGGRRRKAASPLDHAPRPPNAFILFRRHWQPSVTARFPEVDTRGISRILGKMWREAEDREKERFQRLARDVKVEHEKLYPGYKYSRRKRVAA